MEDSPGLEVRNGLFDDISDFVDRGVEFRLPVQEVPVGGFPDRGDHVVSDVAFVAHPVSWVECVDDAGQCERGRVVSAPVHRVRDPGQSAVEVAHNLDVQTGGLVLAGVQLPMAAP